MRHCVHLPARRRHRRNAVEEEVGRVRTAESLVSQMMENEEKWAAITNSLTYTRIMQKEEEDKRQ